MPVLFCGQTKYMELVGSLDGIVAKTPSVEGL